MLKKRNPASWSGDGRVPQFDLAGARSTAGHNRPDSDFQVIRAELIGANVCTAADLTATGAAPVLALCRQLVAAGFDSRCPLDAYRDNKLALRVRSIGQGARLTVKDNRFGRPAFTRCQGVVLGDAAAPPIAPIELAALGVGGAP